MPLLHGVATSFNEGYIQIAGVGLQMAVRLF